MNGKRLVDWALDGLPDGNVITLVPPGLEGTITVDEPTEGAACTALLAAELIDNDTPLLIVNCDQYVRLDWSRFWKAANHPKADGALLLFHCPERDPKWSYAAPTDGSWIYEVREKDPFTPFATCGVYYWAKGSHFCEFARQMVANDFRVNGEFYIAPTYQLAIDAGWNIRGYVVEQMVGLGTPEDVEAAKGLLP